MKMLFAIPRLPVKNIDDSCAFYMENMNFKISYKEIDYAILTSGNVELHLFKWTPINGVSELVANSCRIQVNKIDKLYEQLLSKGIIHPNGKLTKQPWGEKDFTVLDTDNNAINFFEVVR